MDIEFWYSNKLESNSTRIFPNKEEFVSSGCESKDGRDSIIKRDIMITQAIRHIYISRNKRLLHKSERYISDPPLFSRRYIPIEVESLTRGKF